MSKVSGLGGPKISFNKWLSAGGEAESAGEKIGKELGTGIKKSLSLLDWFQKANIKGLNDWFSNAVKNGQKEFSSQSFGGGISQIASGPNMMKELESQLDAMFKVSPDAQLDAMRKKSDEAFARKQQKEDATQAKLDEKKMASLSKQLEHDKNFFKNMVVGGIATLFNPFVGARMMSDTIGKSGAGKTEKGIFGAAGAMGYGEIFIAVKVLETAFKLLTKAVINTVAAYETARQLYAKSLMQGLGLNFTAKRGMIASVLGVSETEVMRFGAAMNYLNPKLAFAAETLAKTAVPLTGVGWEFKILSENIKALWAQMAEGLAPAVKALMIELNDFLVTMGRTGNIEFLAQILSKIFQSLVNTIGAIELLGATFAAQFSLIRDAFKLMIQEIVLLIPGAGKLLGIKASDAQETKDHISGTLSALGNQASDFFKNATGGKLNDVPPPIAQMKQLPASAWEKMGLVVGGGANNYQKDIAKNTRDTANAMKALTAALRKSGMAPSFGYSPNTAQP